MNGQAAADRAEALAIAAYKVDPIEMELREEAAALIEKRGWTSGLWERPSGEICLKQALILVCRHAPLSLFDQLVQHLERRLGEDLETWNDAEGRTREDVLAVLRGTAS